MLYLFDWSNNFSYLFRTYIKLGDYYIILISINWTSHTRKRKKKAIEIYYIKDIDNIYSKKKKNRHINVEYLHAITIKITCLAYVRHINSMTKPFTTILHKNSKWAKLNSPNSSVLSCFGLDVTLSSNRQNNPCSVNLKLALSYCQIKYCIIGQL